MNDTHIKSIIQVQSFLVGSEAVTFEPNSREEGYLWVSSVLERFRYHGLCKRDKSVIQAYLRKTTGYSRQQLTRLVAQYSKTGHVIRTSYQRRSFSLVYGREDILLLAKMDELHQTLSGPATKKLCERAFSLYGQSEYKRLAGISIAHLYNLRKVHLYRQNRYHFTKTQRVGVAIGERRKPNPDGQPGYLRIDTVHQGDEDKRKGVYHINVIDEITQWEIVCTVEKISEAYLIPILEFLLTAFPFVIQGFHSDNGSEYVNRLTAELLQKLFVEFTKSRARHTNDNALIEGKNGSIVRKYLGYGYIAQRWAPLINAFNQTHLNPYLNFHRPCFFPVTIVNAKGKQKKTYPYKSIMTPYDKLKSLPTAEQYLKPSITFKQLDAVAYAMSDNEAAQRTNQAKKKLFKTIFKQEKGVISEPLKMARIYSQSLGPFEGPAHVDKCSL